MAGNVKVAKSGLDGKVLSGRKTIMHAMILVREKRIQNLSEN
jgi:hypothetical protein